jgi:GT2 family glycosyltransferase
MIPESSIVDIVIVNWNSGSDLDRCLDALSGTAKGSSWNVTVVDNGSTDGSHEAASSVSALPVRVIALARNVGFAAACNRGAAPGIGKYILFLNPDAVMGVGCLQTALAFMESTAATRIGICGVKLLDDDDRVQHHCARFPTLLTSLGRVFGLNRVLPSVFPTHFMVEFDHLSSREVDQVIGAFFLVRRDLFEELSGFDERFFVYYEELDFSLRAHRAGWRTWYLAEAQSHHAGGGSSRKIKARRLFYSVRSQMLYGFKHFGRLRGSVLAALLLVVEPLSRSARALARRSWSELRDTWRGYAMLYCDLPTIFRVALRRKGIVPAEG